MQLVKEVVEIYDSLAKEYRVFEIPRFRTMKCSVYDLGNVSQRVKG